MFVTHVTHKHHQPPGCRAHLAGISGEEINYLVSSILFLFCLTLWKARVICSTVTVPLAFTVRLLVGPQCQDPR